MPRSAERPAAAHVDVRIDEMPARPAAYFEQSAPVAPAPVVREDGPFVPPVAEQPMRQPRLPQIDDLPPHIRDQIRAHQAGAVPPPPPSDQRRRTLLERLAAFGSSRDEGAPAAPPPPAPRPVSPAALDYAKRAVPPMQRAQPTLDQHGRAMPVARSHEEDQLEIPAFLRRQSN